MSRRELISGFWAAMQTNDSERAASYLAAGCVIAWPCSEERIVGPSEFAAIQARYPTKTGQRSFEVHRLVVEGDTVVSKVTVTDGEQSARVVAFSDIDGDRTVRQLEYWPTAYEPLPAREDLFGAAACGRSRPEQTRRVLRRAELASGRRGDRRAARSSDGGR